MEMTSLRQQSWQTRMRAQSLRVQAQTTAIAVQRQQVLIRERQERFRLQRIMPDAHGWIIHLTAHLLVARNLDAYVRQQREGSEESRRGP